MVQMYGAETRDQQSFPIWLWRAIKPSQVIAERKYQYRRSNVCLHTQHAVQRSPSASRAWVYGAAWVLCLTLYFMPLKTTTAWWFYRPNYSDLDWPKSMIQIEFVFGSFLNLASIILLLHFICDDIMKGGDAWCLWPVFPQKYRLVSTKQLCFG